MESIKVNIKNNPYNIYIGNRAINELIPLIITIKNVSKIAIITNDIVANLYLSPLKNVISENYKTEVFIVPDGEKSKSLNQTEKIYSWLIEKRFDRDSLILAFGGGVIGDLAGFVASTYLRGVRFIQIPTTLLAQVDSSIGGKVGVNHQLGKNLIGAFYQPQFVLSDINFLKTLSKEEYICGLGEVVKYALIGNTELFEFLLSNQERISADHIQVNEYFVLESARQKAMVVEKDEKEMGIRATLNFGHTFGHALEKFYNYQNLKHGQAVLFGMKCAVNASQLLGYLQPGTACKITDLINRFDIHLPNKLNNSNILDLIDFMQHDKKVKGGQVQYILIKDIGKVFKTKIEDEKIIRQAFESLN